MAVELDTNYYSNANTELLSSLLMVFVFTLYLYR